MSDTDTVIEPAQQLIVSRDGVIAETVGAEIDQQIATARAYPRIVSRSLEKCQSMATASRRIAENCRYALKRGGKVIEGPSVRFAEILAHTWGNTRSGSRVVGYDSKHLTAQGVVVDLEGNNAITIDVKRRITGRDGRTFSDDMITVTAQAASSIALRNAIFAGIPRGLWDHVFHEVEKVIMGDAKDLQQMLQMMYDTLAASGVSKARIHAACGAEGQEDMSLKRIAFVRSLYQAVMDGEASLEQNFPEVDKARPAQKAKEPSLDDLAAASPPPPEQAPENKEEPPKEEGSKDSSEEQSRFFKAYAKDLERAKDADELARISQLANKDSKLSQEEQLKLLEIGDAREAELMDMEG